MTNLINRFGFLLLFLVFPIGAGCRQNSSGPELKVERPRQVLSARYKGPSQLEFVLTNVGDRNLQIEDVVSSCGCAAVEWPARTLRPTETTKLLVRVSRPAIGSQLATITLLTNSASNRVVTLETETHAISNEPRIMEITPYRVSFTDVQFGETASTLRVKSVERKDDRLIDSITTTLPCVRCEIGAVDETPFPDGRFVARQYHCLVVAEDCTQGHLSGDIVIRFTDDHGMTSERRVPLTVDVIGRLSVTPRVLFAVARFNEGPPRPWHLRLTHQLSTRDIASLTVSSNAKWLNARIVRNDHTAATEEILVEVISAPKSLPAQAELLLECGLERVVIPVTLAEPP